MFCGLVFLFLLKGWIEFILWKYMEVFFKSIMGFILFVNIFLLFNFEIIIEFDIFVGNGKVFKFVVFFRFIDKIVKIL